MYRIEIITFDDVNKMKSKDIFYSNDYDRTVQFVKEKKELIWNNWCIFFEETHEWAIVQININDFIVNNKLATWADFIAVWNILERNYVSDAINDYINSDF